MRSWVRIVAAAGLLGSVSVVQAIPLQLDATQFGAALSGASSIAVEDFESYTGTDQSNPFTFSNGTYTSAGSFPQVVSGGTFCGTLGDQCLLSQTILDTRTFGGFAAGTNLFGADLHFILATDLFQVNVTGGSGVLSFQATGASFSGFAGFFDALGLISISFLNLGTSGVGSGNYSFDNVTTAMATVPEPATLTLLLGGLLCFVLGRRRLIA